MAIRPAMSMFIKIADYEKAMKEWLAKNHKDSKKEETYDAKGNLTPSGIYDAGGHVIPERYASQVDYYHDRIRDRDN